MAHPASRKMTFVNITKRNGCDVMGFELDGIIKGVLYNKDETVDYVFDDGKLDEVIAPFVNENDTERDQNKTLFLSSSENFEVSFKSADISEDVLYLIGVLHWYNWWNGDKIEYDFGAIK